jgi:hypothetical protein
MTPNEKSFNIVKSVLQSAIYMYGAYGLYRLFRHGGVKSDDSGDLSHDDDEGKFIDDYHEEEIPAPTMKFSNTKSLHDEDDD